MREKAREFADNLSRKQAVLGVAVVLFVAGGTATALDFFGTASGDLDVDNQAVSSFDVDTSYTGSAAPTTDYNTVEITNNNDDRFVSFKWAALSSDNFDAKRNSNAYREVYRVENFDLTSDDKEETTDSAVEDFYVEVIPNVDEVKYRVHVGDEWFSNSQANADVQVSPTASDSEDNYHVKFSGDSHSGSGGGETIEQSDNWAFFKPSKAKNTAIVGKSNILDRAEVRDLSTSEGYFTVTVAREVATPQSFGVSVHQAHEYSSGSWNSVSTDGFSYKDSDQSGVHKEVDTTDYLGTVKDLEPSETVEYNVGAFLDSSTPSDETYTLAVGAEPVTP
jgi:hypothetical protein